jgi:hypothetical protein
MWSIKTFRAMQSLVHCSVGPWQVIDVHDSISAKIDFAAQRSIGLGLRVVCRLPHSCLYFVSLDFGFYE